MTHIVTAFEETLENKNVVQQNVNALMMELLTTQEPKSMEIAQNLRNINIQVGAMLTPLTKITHIVVAFEETLENKNLLQKNINTLMMELLTTQEPKLMAVAQKIRDINIQVGAILRPLTGA